MSLAFQNVGQPVASGRPEVMDQRWVEWLRNLWRSLGHDPLAPRYDEVSVGSASWDVTGGAVPTFLTTHLLAVEFAATFSNRWSSFAVRLPNSYRPGTALSPWLDWGASDAAAGTVAWQFIYAALGREEDLPSETALSETDDAPGSTQPQRLDFDDIDGEGLEPGDVVLCAIKRLGASDTYGSGARAYAAGLKYQRVGVGHEGVHP